MAVEIVYFVHGTTYDNAENRCSGWKQVELNDLGKEQAKNLGKNTNYKFDILFTSDLIRAIESANIAWPKIEKKIAVKSIQSVYLSRTFASKLFIKLCRDVIDPIIICLQTLKYEPENRKQEEIESTIPYLKTLENFSYFINYSSSDVCSCFLHNLLIFWNHQSQPWI